MIENEQQHAHCWWLLPTSRRRRVAPCRLEESLEPRLLHLHLQPSLVSAMPSSCTSQSLPCALPKMRPRHMPRGGTLIIIDTATSAAAADVAHLADRVPTVLARLILGFIRDASSELLLWGMEKSKGIICGARCEILKERRANER